MLKQKFIANTLKELPKESDVKFADDAIFEAKNKHANV